MGLLPTVESRAAEVEFGRTALACAALHRRKDDEGLPKSPLPFDVDDGDERTMVCVASGVSYLGMALANQLLLQGYSVRITVQTQVSLMPSSSTFLDVRYRVCLDSSLGERTQIPSFCFIGKTTILKILGGKQMLEPDMVRVLGRSAFHDTNLVASGDLCYLGGEFGAITSVSLSFTLQEKGLKTPLRFTDTRTRINQQLRK